MINPRLYTFTAGASGSWRIREIRGIRGETLKHQAFLDFRQGHRPIETGDAWTLTGVKSNERYTTREEKTQMVNRQEGLGRPQATCAVLIPIRKTGEWWAMTQDERRAVFEGQSQHTRNALAYLPAIARSLHHCRDLPNPEPFDFLTWFEFAPEDECKMDELLEFMRKSPEWNYVDREVDIRLVRV